MFGPTPRFVDTKRTFLIWRFDLALICSAEFLKNAWKDLSFCEHLLSNETVFFHLFFGLIQIGLGYGAFLWFPLKEWLA